MGEMGLSGFGGSCKISDFRPPLAKNEKKKEKKEKEKKEKNKKKGGKKGIESKIR